jgi:hypothetical protein
MVVVDPGFVVVVLDRVVVVAVRVVGLPPQLATRTASAATATDAAP